jgi:hypothetical protein
VDWAMRRAKTFEAARHDPGCSHRLIPCQSSAVADRQPHPTALADPTGDERPKPHRSSTGGRTEPGDAKPPATEGGGGRYPVEG